MSLETPRRCYLSGPMRGRPEFNFPAFFAGQERLEAAGWAVFNPARMETREDQTADDLGTPPSFRRYAKRDLAIIVDTLRAEDGDAIVVLPDWEQSTGAKAEVAVARWVGLPVLTLEEATR